MGTLLLGGTRERFKESNNLARGHSVAPYRPDSDIRSSMKHTGGEGLHSSTYAASLACPLYIS